MERNRTFEEELENIDSKEHDMSALQWFAEQMPGGCFIYREEPPYEILYVNKAVCDIYGCETVEEFREFVGNSFKGMVHPDDFDTIQKSIDDQIQEKDNAKKLDYVDYRIPRKDGQIRWVSDYGHLANVPGIGSVYYVFIADVTDIKLAREEKERADLLKEELEGARRANEAKSAFLSNMSHEIRTPITAILGMNEMIQRETDESEILEYSENIRKAGVSLLGIISDILDFSKIETGRMELESEVYHIPSVVVDLYNMVRFRTEAKGLELDFTVDPTMPKSLYGDEVRLKQIITNLLTNAVKYTEKGCVSCDISYEKKSEDEVVLTVSVTDTGIGIRKEDVERLFEPFDRLDLKKTRSIEGAGLGLAITRQLLNLMDSELKVESEYGVGSKFYFSVTQKVADNTTIGDIDFHTYVDENQGIIKKKGFLTAPGMRLLVVDDTPMNLQVIVGLLRRSRMHIDVAVSGRECIEKFGKEHYDLVFLDYRMPNLNGIETLNEIKDRFPKRYATTPIISLTASAVAGDKEKLLNAGFTDYLTKPVNVDEMEGMMLKYLPADSVIMSDDNDDEDDELYKLPKAILTYPQLNPKKGLEYCGDAEDYMFALETYELAIETKSKQIEEFVENEDWDNYILNVHSLKSTSGAIGAEEIFEKAKTLEQAGKNKDYDMVRRDTPFLLKEYRNLKDILHRLVKQYNGASSDNESLSVVEEERSQMLARALEEAQRANMAKTAFLSNMSHEIRTPMNAIIGLYNIALRRQDLDEETKDTLIKIGDSAKHLLSLINDILDISRIESGNSQLNEEKFSFSSMLEQVNTMTESQCEEKGLEFKCSVKGSLDDDYIGDDMKLKQVIINVLGNAVKYTPKGGAVTFTVEELERDKDRAQVKFVIEDTGVGMDSKYIPLLFEPFSQEKEGTSNAYGSTGLGMAITKHIIDMMCGGIEVDSEKGKGTKFEIRIPLGICDDSNSMEDELEGAYAIVVDDDKTACEHAVMVLGRLGVKADIALNAEDAIMMINKQSSLMNPYKYAFLDWKMPNKDGIELTKDIRRSYGHDEIAIFLTTYNWDEIMETAMEAGVDEFIAKPLFAGGILKAVNVLTEKRSKGKIVDESHVDLSGKKVLLAEDMEINAEIMKQILNLKAIEVDVATNGEEALKMFLNSKEGYYDAILMDIRMPVKNGLEACEEIRATDRKDANIPVIALTANAFDEDVQLSLDAGMNAHLSKPVEPDALFAMLERYV